MLNLINNFGTVLLICAAALFAILVGGTMGVFVIFIGICGFFAEFVIEAFISILIIIAGIFSKDKKH